MQSRLHLLGEYIKTKSAAQSKFLLLTFDLAKPMELLQPLIDIGAQIFVCGTANVYDQIKTLLVDHSRILRFQFIRNIHADDFFREAAVFAPDYILSYNFYRKIPDRVFKLASVAAVNFHPSLLPNYPGGAPHTKPIEMADDIFGVSAHLIVTQFDSGHIMHQVSAPLPANATELWILARYNELMLQLINEFIAMLDGSNVPLYGNDPNGIKAPMRRMRDFWFNPRQKASVLEAQARARSSGLAPGLLVSVAKHKPLQILEIIVCNTVEEKLQQAFDAHPVGTLFFWGDRAYIKCGRGYLELRIVRHLDIGTVSIERYFEIEQMDKQQSYLLVYPGLHSKMAAQANIKASWFYAPVDQKFGDSLWQDRW